jgi:hypothetical protein
MIIFIGLDSQVCSFIWTWSEKKTMFFL